MRESSAFDEAIAVIRRARRESDDLRDRIAGIADDLAHDAGSARDDGAYSWSVVLDAHARSLREAIGRA